MSLVGFVPLYNKLYPVVATLEVFISWQSQCKGSFILPLLFFFFGYFLDFLVLLPLNNTDLCPCQILLKVIFLKAISLAEFGWYQGSKNVLELIGVIERVLMNFC